MEVSHILPAVLDESELWNYLFTVMDAVGGTPLASRVDQLAKRFDLDTIAPSSRTVIDSTDISGDPNTIELVKRFAQYLGYHYKNLQADPNAFLRFTSESVRLGPDAGNSKCFSFIKYLINGYLEIKFLYYDPTFNTYVTEDDPSIAGRRIVLDGFSDAQNAYPTPYITAYVAQGTGLPTQALVDLMYSIMPENIVIHSLETVFVAPVVYAPDVISTIVVDLEPTFEISF